jgi:YesN/AraC family two-component response regulator
MQRIYLLIEKEKPYLSSELKVSDIAEKLNTSSRNISDCIKNSTNNTFVNFINTYRIDYAKQLMRQQPDMKISEVFLSSGFANETTFFRIFKTLTGMTPNEWKTNGQEKIS